jgi:cytochrome c oxidase cbb3-type subunit I
LKIPVGIKVFVDAAGVDPAYARIIHRYVLSGAFWLLFATAGGLLDAFRFVMPELLEVSWLSFGRVRPMHTSSALWGWASLALLGVVLYVVPRSCRTTLYSIRLARVSLWLWNAAVALGVTAISVGQSNGNQEYREWPIFLKVGGVRSRSSRCSRRRSSSSRGTSTRRSPSAR